MARGCTRNGAPADQCIFLSGVSSVAISLQCQHFSPVVTTSWIATQACHTELNPVRFAHAARVARVLKPLQNADIVNRAGPQGAKRSSLKAVVAATR
jgi:hypothetical protein